eukprot:TRINITY_DN7882_c0_g1_i1.p1 TRINITY_DN7882_c0_g1~~TRINITY_DN7882_c0_g1_i1.p1  ORF type:complete len:249 (-),score=5.17 TRINITY_DN7882_c0_g1_i1:75-776(-)
MELFGESEHTSSTFGKWSASIEPSFSFPLRNTATTLTLTQNSKGFGELGSRLWDGGIVLARYIEKLGPVVFEGRKVIELGAGCGLTSLVALLQGADVVATDKASLLGLLSHNLEANVSSQEVKSRFHTAELLWGTGNPFGAAFDIILGADLTYDFEDLPVLVSTLVDLSSETSAIFIAYGKERAAAPTFLELAAQHFELHHVNDAELDPGDVKVPSFDISIVRLVKKVVQIGS